MATRNNFYIGLNDKDTKKQEISSEKALEIIENVFDTFSEYGATIYDCKGLYKHTNGYKVRENTIGAFTIDLDRETIKQICKVLKETLNQESILVVNEHVDVEFM